jgi:hypothetical protein
MRCDAVSVDYAERINRSIPRAICVILGRFTDLFIFLEKPGSADPVLPTSTQIDGGCVHEVGAEAARPSS